METRRKYISSDALRSLLSQLLYGLLLLGLVFSLRAVVSLSVGAMLLAGLLLYPERLRKIFRTRGFVLLLLAGLACLAADMISSYTAGADPANWNHFRTRSALVLVPFAFYLFPPLQHLASIMRIFCVQLLVATCVCLLIAAMDFFRNGDGSVFFYHQLVSPFSHHAIYFSFLLLLALIYLIEKKRTGETVIQGRAENVMIIFFVIILLLLSSKLMIVFFLLYAFSFLLRLLLPARPELAVGFASVMVLAMLFLQAGSPTSQRFREILHTNLSVLNRQHFQPADYFDGLQFRLLQWRFVPEILEEDHAWTTGVSAAQTQQRLGRKFLEKNMYAGDPGKGDRGYLAYNTHNQFLETLLRSGITGIFMLLFLWVALFRLVRGNRMALIIAILLLAWSMTESILESQYGLVYFFFPVLFMNNKGSEGQPFEVQ